MTCVDEAVSRTTAGRSPRYRVLVVNPGSTSTKIAVYLDESLVFQQKISYSAEELAKFEGVLDQRRMRLDGILEALDIQGEPLQRFAAVVARGGLLKPVEGGVYEVNDRMVHDLVGAGPVSHASNLGAPIAREIAGMIGVRAFIADPIVVDELWPMARLSGLPEVPRRSIFHALNHKAVARQAARDLGTHYEQVNFVVAHLGGGITIGAHLKGRVVDVSNGLDGEGPFAPERSGGLPILGLVDLCFSGEYTEGEVMKKLIGGGGLMAHLGTNDGVEVERRIDAGDEYATLIYEAMAYQIAKEIGACAAVIDGEVDGIIITGGMAHSSRLVEWISSKVQYIAPVLLYPGENEMGALAEACLRVLRKEEEAKAYM